MQHVYWLQSRKCFLFLSRIEFLSLLSNMYTCVGMRGAFLPSSGTSVRCHSCQRCPVSCHTSHRCLYAAATKTLAKVLAAAAKQEIGNKRIYSTVNITSLDTRWKIIPFKRHNQILRGFFCAINPPCYGISICRTLVFESLVDLLLTVVEKIIVKMASRIVFKVRCGVTVTVCSRIDFSFRCAVL